MKKYIYAIVLALLCCACKAYAEGEQDMWTMQDDVKFYNSITVSADYAARPVFKPMAYTPHDLVEDIKVSAIESVPFGFLYTFAGLWIYKAVSDHTLTPKVGTLAENQGTYFIAVGAFMALNVGINVFTFYDYNKNQKGAKVEKEKTGP